MIYGYARVSTKDQSIERQERNILAVEPTAKIYKEKYTGTKIVGRTEFNKLLKAVRQDDTIIFDSVSRMSRNAQEGIDLYMELYSKGINLIFIKESYINTSVYKEALAHQLETVGNDIADIYIEATNKVLMILAEKQIKLAFEQAEKEVKDLQQRTKEGMETARRNGKQIGAVQGKKLITKKSIEAKEQIQRHSKDFGGTLSDKECMKLIGIANNTYYKYKRELLVEQEQLEQIESIIDTANEQIEDVIK